MSTQLTLRPSPPRDAETTIHQEKYVDSGIDIEDLNKRDDDVDFDDTPLDTERSAALARTTSTVHLFVTETAEFENPADGAVTFIRDLMAASKKNRAGQGNWGLRRRGGEKERRPVYAVVAVGERRAPPRRSTRNTTPRLHTHFYTLYSKHYLKKTAPVSHFFARARIECVWFLCVSIIIIFWYPHQTECLYATG